MKKKLNVTFCSFPDFSSNARPLYEYMKRKYKDSMNFAWVVRTDEMYTMLKEQGISVYKLDTEEYFSFIKRTDVFFSTHADIARDKPNGSLYIELWHGLSLKQIGFLSDNVSEFDYAWYDNLKKKIDYFIVPSDFWRVIFATRFNVDYRRTLALGYPKFDDFNNKNCFLKLEKVIGEKVKKYKKIIYYMPTYRKGCNRQDSSINSENIFNIASYDEGNLISYLKKNNYLLCLKKHPSEELDLPILENDNIKIITDDSLSSNAITLNEILNASDLLITDYSSLGIEYTFLNKPVIYLTNDINEYIDNRGITFNDYNFWMPGHKVNDYDGLIKAIDNSFSNDYCYRDEELQKRNLWFGDLNDGGCDKICEFLFNQNEISSNVKYYVDYEEKLENDIINLDNYICSLQKELLEKETQINIIINSKGWKFLELIRKVKRKILRK